MDNGSTDLTPGGSPALLASQAPIQRLLALHAGRGSANTNRAYASELKRFAAFVDAPDVPAAMEALLQTGAGEANAMVLDYRNNLVGAGLAPSTVNRALAAIRYGADVDAVVWLPTSLRKLTDTEDGFSRGRQATFDKWLAAAGDTGPTVYVVEDVTKLALEGNGSVDDDTAARALADA